MDFFGTAYLKAIKEKVRQDTPSKAVIEALKELQRINMEQAKEINVYKGHINALKQQNNYLIECLQQINKDHEDYRLSKEGREKNSIAIEIELRREIQRLENNRNRLTAHIASLNAVEDKQSMSGSNVSEESTPFRQMTSDSRRVDTSRLISEGSKVLVEDVMELQRQIMQLTESNQKLTKAILSSTGDEIIDVRTEMRNNNRQIAKLKTVSAQYKSKEQTFLEYTSR